MKVLITGSRNWVDILCIANILKQVKVQYPDVTIIHGNQRGADLIAHAVAEQFGIPSTGYDAHWFQFGKGAGPIRNQRMLEQKPDVVIAFHDHIAESKGTKDMIKRANYAGVTCYLLGTKSRDVAFKLMT